MIRFHIKILTAPFLSVASMVSGMKQTYGQYGIGVDLVSQATLDIPDLATRTVVNVGGCSGAATGDQAALFGMPMAMWSGWINLGKPTGGFGGRPATVSRSSQYCNVYVRGADNALWGRAWDGSWHGWQRHDDGGRLSAPPAPGSMTSEHEHIFGRGMSGGLWQKWWLAPTRATEIVVFFILGNTGSAGSLNGCATYPPGQPGAVVTQTASQWTLAHEVGHVLGLQHCDGPPPNCPCLAYGDLMTGCGTGKITQSPPVLGPFEQIFLKIFPLSPL